MFTFSNIFICVVRKLENGIGSTAPISIYEKYPHELHKKPFNKEYCVCVCVQLSTILLRIDNYHIILLNDAYFSPYNPMPPIPPKIAYYILKILKHFTNYQCHSIIILMAQNTHTHVCVCIMDEAAKERERERRGENVMHFIKQIDSSFRKLNFLFNDVHYKLLPATSVDCVVFLTIGNFINGATQPQ